MAGYRQHPETGEREFVEDDRQTEQPVSPTPRDNFVERFLAGQQHVPPSLPTRHGPGGRFYHRKSRRRV